MRLFYLSLLLLFIGMSCQKNYSEDTLLGYLSSNQSLEKSNDLIFKASKKLLWEIEATSKTKVHYQALFQKASAFSDAGIDLYQWIDKIKQHLIRETGGYYKKEEAIEKQQPFLENSPKGANNTELIEAFFLGEKSKYEDSLDQKIQVLIENYSTLLKSCWKKGGIPYTIFIDKSKQDSIFDYLNNHLTFRSSKNYDASISHVPTWAAFHFQNQPLAAVLLSLTCIQNNIRTSENAFLNFLAKQTSYGDLVYDNFLIYAYSHKPNLQLGETYEAEIGLGSYASKVLMEVIIDGDTLSAVDGIVQYSTRPKKVGQQKYTAKVILTNPLTREQEVFRREFGFKVIP